MSRHGSNSSTREITLLRGQITIVDADDYDKVSTRKWVLGANGYAVSYKSYGMILMHRLIMNTPKGKVVDHINGNKLDNRKSNLRNCTHAENMQNRFKANSKSGFRNVYWHARLSKWVVLVKKDKKMHYFGSFINKEEAIQAARSARTSLFGKYAGNI